MRYSILLLASSVALRVSDNPVAEAAGSAVYDTKQDHTIHEITNIIRPQRLLRSSNTTEDEERMNSALLFFKSPEQILKNLGVEKTTGTYSHTENVNTIMKTMEHKNMGQILEVFKRKRLVKNNAFLSTFLKDRMGLDELATALGRAKASQDETVAENGKKLLQELMQSLDVKARGDYNQFFEQLKLKTVPIEAHSYNWRFELLDDYIKFKSNGQPTDRLLFKTLIDGYKKVDELALVIARSKMDERTKEKAKAFETRFVKYFVDEKTSADSFFKQIGLHTIGYKMFKDSRFGMMKQFLVLEGVDKTEIPQQMLNLFIKGFGDEEKLAITLSKGVASRNFKEESAVYEMLLFQHLKQKNIDPDKVFTSEELASEPARTFKERYQDWYNKH